MSKKMTPWFQGTIPPARSGVYELARIPGPLSYAYFNADTQTWYCSADHVHQAIAYGKEQHLVSCAARPVERTAACWQWRGFTEEQRA